MTAEHQGHAGLAFADLTEEADSGHDRPLIDVAGKLNSHGWHGFPKPFQAPADLRKSAKYAVLQPGKERHIPGENHASKAQEKKSLKNGQHKAD
jgi:hypothetical protein